MKRRYHSDMVTAPYADEDGQILDVPGIRAMGRIGSENVPISPKDLIPLPDTADLMYMPGCRAVGIDQEGEEIVIPGYAVAAILPAGYTRSFVPAYERENDSERLALYGYTAVCLYHGELYTTAIYTDENHKWDPDNYNTDELLELTKRVKKEIPDNRLVDHLANCSLEWHCQTAENLFYHRWEAGLPTSPVCNAKCFGCISFQPDDSCDSPQHRIGFKPTAEEIAQVGIYHLSSHKEAIISFGQGCEGEPSLAADRIAPAIHMMREKTSYGQININTNAGWTDGIKKIVDAGLDTMRVSIISAIPESYDAYYRASYHLDDVKDSIRYALDHGIYVSLNMLYFPGFNDCDEELGAWKVFIKDVPIQMIQVRNLNVDPDAFLEIMPHHAGNKNGTKYFLKELHDTRPDMVIGSFSHYVEDR